MDWEADHQVWDKVKEELHEFEEEVNHNSSHEKIEGEFGDILFSLINYARHLNINPEDALERTNKKFIKRFNFLEKTCNENNWKMDEIGLEKMDEIWEKAKLQD